MKLRNILGLTLLGTALYAHKQRGGELTVDSLKKGLRDLLLAIQNKAVIAKDRAEYVADKAHNKVKDVAANVENKAKGVATTTRGFADDIGAYIAGDNGTPRR